MTDRSFKTEDPRGFTIHLPDDWYNRHIKGRHSEVDVEYVLQVIETPDFIAQDVDHSTRENYFKYGILDKYPQAFLKVCVETARTRRAVLTAFKTNYADEEATVLWKKKK